MMQFYAKGWQDAGPKPLISSVRVGVAGGHARISVWNRGGKSGELVVNKEDADAIVDRILPVSEREDFTVGKAKP